MVGRIDKLKQMRKFQNLWMLSGLNGGERGLLNIDWNRINWIVKEKIWINDLKLKVSYNSAKYGIHPISYKKWDKLTKERNGKKKIIMVRYGSSETHDEIPKFVNAFWWYWIKNCWYIV